MPTLETEEPETQWKIEIMSKKGDTVVMMPLFGSVLEPRSTNMPAPIERIR